MNNESQRVDRTTAHSGKVDYSDATVIRGGPKARTHFEVAPVYVPRSSGHDDVSLRLKYWKDALRGLRTGVPAEFTLSSGEVLKLRDCIDKSLALADQEAGQYLLIKLDDAEATSIAGRDAAKVGNALLKVLADPSLATTIADLPGSTELIEGLQTIVRVKSLSAAVSELREALSDGIVAEAFYQTWCEVNSWAFGSHYVMRDDVRNIAIGDAVDHLVKRTTDRFRDIFELKRPNHDVLLFDATHKSYYWGSEVAK